MNSRGGSTPKLKAKKRMLWMLVGVLTVWALWFVIALMNTRGEMGLFGDSFGALNALFSGLALAGVIIALTLQSEELELQRGEIRLNREEMERSTV